MSAFIVVPFTYVWNGKVEAFLPSIKLESLFHFHFHSIVCVVSAWLLGWLSVCLSVICVPSIILIISRDNKYSLACSAPHDFMLPFFAFFLYEKFVLYSFFANEDDDDDRDFYFVYWANQLFASPACRYPFKIYFQSHTNNSQKPYYTGEWARAMRMLCSKGIFLLDVYSLSGDFNNHFGLIFTEWTSQPTNECNNIFSFWMIAENVWPYFIRCGVLYTSTAQSKMNVHYMKRSDFHL